MLEFVLELIIAVFFVEGVTELFVKSEIFKPVREYFSRFDWKYFQLSTVVNCGYCFSVWVSIPTAFVFSLLTFKSLSAVVFFTFVFTVVFHRLSNHFHNLADKHFDKFYRSS